LGRTDFGNLVGLVWVLVVGRLIPDSLFLFYHGMMMMMMMIDDDDTRMESVGHLCLSTIFPFLSFASELKWNRSHI